MKTVVQSAARVILQGSTPRERTQWGGGHPCSDLLGPICIWHSVRGNEEQRVTGGTFRRQSPLLPYLGPFHDLSPRSCSPFLPVSSVFLLLRLTFGLNPCTLHSQAAVSQDSLAGDPKLIMPHIKTKVKCLLLASLHFLGAP